MFSKLLPIISLLWSLVSARIADIQLQFEVTEVAIQGCWLEQSKGVDCLGSGGRHFLVKLSKALTLGLHTFLLHQKWMEMSG